MSLLKHGSITHTPTYNTYIHTQHNIKEVLLFPAMKPDQARQLQNAQIAEAARAAIAKTKKAASVVELPPVGAMSISGGAAGGQQQG